MGFVDDLVSGAGGVRCRLPQGKVLGTGASVVTLAEPTRGVLVTAAHLPWRLALRDEDAGLLRDDSERLARHIFETTFAALDQKTREAFPHTGGRPRTADPTWTPLIELETIAIPGGRALRVLRRIEYRPGCEVIETALLVPTATGTFQISGVAMDRQTGGRESALMFILLGKMPPGGKPSFPSQSEYDDPRHDASFPTHALSRARAFLRELIEKNAVELTAPVPEPEVGRCDFVDGRCTIVPPRRFLRLAPGIIGPKEGVLWFSRVAVSIAETPRLFSVARETQRVLPTYDALAAHAEGTTRDWSNQGVADVEVAAERRPDRRGRPVVALRITYRPGKEPCAASQLWTLGPDGAMYRVTQEAPAYLRPDELMSGVEESFATLRFTGEGEEA
jgi:hypothetical protein